MSRCSTASFHCSAQDSDVEFNELCPQYTASTRDQSYPTELIWIPVRGNTVCLGKTTFDEMKKSPRYAETVRSSRSLAGCFGCLKRTLCIFSTNRSWIQGTSRDGGIAWWACKAARNVPVTKTGTPTTNTTYTNNRKPRGPRKAAKARHSAVSGPPLLGLCGLPVAMNKAVSDPFHPIMMLGRWL